MGSIRRKPLTYSTFDAKANLSQILDRVADGEEVVITRHGKAVAKVVPMPKPGKRTLGFAAGEIGFRPGWDKPLTTEELIGE